MANILMINLPYAGHTNPTLPLAKSLVKKGHLVSYINAEEFRSEIEAAGAAFIPYINYPDSPDEQQKKKLCFRAAFDTALSLTGDYDLLIYEMFFYPGLQIAKRLGIPCVRQFSQPAWNKNTMAFASRMFKISCTLIDRQVMGKQNAAYMGLPHSSLADAVTNDRPALNIVYVSQKFQPCRDSFGEDYIFVPPMPEPEADMPTSDIPYRQMRRPIAYISLGSIISNRGFYKECIRAFGRKPLSVILNTGKIHPQSLGNIPENIYAYSFVPQKEVLRHADVFLTHCGMNSVNEAISCGVPMVAMPFVNDQISNARRIVELGIGKRVRSFPSRGKELYQTVDYVLRDKAMKDRCVRLQLLLQTETSMEEAVERIETLL